MALPAALAGLRDEIEAMLLLSSLALARAEAPLSVTGGGRLSADELPRRARRALARLWVRRRKVKGDRGSL